MQAFRKRWAWPHRLALAILAGAVLMRVLIPQGWMPVETADGWRITICTGMGPMRMEMPGAMASAMNAMHHGQPGHDQGGSDHPCAFAGFAMALDEPPLPMLDLPRFVAQAWLPVIVATVGIGRGLAAPPPPATGPPAIR